MAEDLKLSCKITLNLHLVIALLAMITLAGGNWFLLLSEAQSNVLPDDFPSTEQISNNIKIFLTKMKIREVPLAKARSEQSLSDLYNEERELENYIEEVEKNMEKTVASNLRIRTNSEGNNDEQQQTSESLAANKIQSKIAKFADFKAKELEQSKFRLTEVKKRIADAKFISKHPENYILVPQCSTTDPKAQQEYERQVLIRDRENMHYRHRLATAHIRPPLWMTDEW